MTDQERPQRRPTGAPARPRGGRMMVGFLVLSTLAVVAVLVLVYRGSVDAPPDPPAAGDQEAIAPLPPAAAGEEQPRGGDP